MYKLHQTISMTSLKSKSLFQSFLLTKFPKSIKLLTRQNRKENLNSTWPLKDHQENRLSFLWVSTILKEVKLEVSTNFIYLDNKDLLLTSNKVVASFDLNVKIVDEGLCFYSILFLNVIFRFLFFSFSIFRTTQVRVYQSRCHISHKLIA